ncbi:unnamed protein product [Anisakis simplex]|uniref:Reelin domain-containing protein n=1 Tax=Anisakis simplex TaxID=6269 RepID=A0A0M3K6K9_ANISI|nr:unnamed protein product [Anisakis simplex]
MLLPLLMVPTRQRSTVLLCLLLVLLGCLSKIPQVHPKPPIDFTATDPACDTMIPSSTHNQIRTTNITFKMRIFDENGKETFEYDAKKRSILYVKIEGGPFVRAHIQARSLAYPTQQIGNFVDPVPQYFKLVNCSGIYGAAIINEDHVTRRHVGVRWKPPRISKGTIVFMASIIRDKQLYHIRSAFLSPISSLISVSSHNCGRSHGCLRVDESSECAFADECLFSLKWQCYKDAMIVDAIHNGGHKSFGLALDDQRAVMCVSRRRSVDAEDFFIVGDNGFPNIFTQSRSKLLKGLREPGRFYCRLDFESFQSSLYIPGEFHYRQTLQIHLYRTYRGNISFP